MAQISRLYFKESISSSQIITLDQEQHHYLTRVMRYKIGEEILLFNHKDGQWRARITSIDKKTIQLQPFVLEKVAPNEKNLGLYFAPIKNVTPSFIVQKATELGVSFIQPIRTRYSVIDKINTLKLKQVAIEAAEQCERFTIPEVYDILPLDKALNSNTCKGPLIFCNENKDGTYLSSYCLTHQPFEAGIIVGPEGGFTKEEIDLLKRKAANVHLGDRILRAETAIICALSIYQSIIENGKH